MARKNASKENKKSSKDKPAPEKLNLPQKLSLIFFKHPRRTFLLWLVIVVFGILSYTTFLKREGFPSIETPFASISGSYLVDNPAKVDKEIAKPLDDFLLKQDGVKSVRSISQGNFFTIIVSYEENVNSETKSNELSSKIKENNLLPKSAVYQFKPFEFGFTDRGDDMVVSVFSSDKDTKQLNDKAKEAVEFLKGKNIADVEDISVIDPFKEAINPVSGEPEVTQQTFDRYGERSNNQNSFYNSVSIGIKAKDGSDNLKLDDQVRSAIDDLKNNANFEGYNAAISASFAPSIDAQVNELQRVLIEGLIAVLIVGSIVITLRASLLTVISMITVLAAAIGFMYLIGYTLNTITLFALILSLALIIDDTIIMVEAIDAERHRKNKPKEIITGATKKISRAMIAATFTAALSFSPLIFVGGILGKFIRAIPTTIISALILSLIAALIFIPFFSRYLILRKSKMGTKSHKELSASLEHGIAEFIAKPMLWARHSKKKLAFVSTSAILLSFGFILAGGFIFTKVAFNIFPEAKDTNEIQVTLNFPPNTSLKSAEAITDKSNKIVSDTLGENFDQASYYGAANNQTAALSITLIDYKDRSIKAPELVKNLENNFKNFNDAAVQVGSVSAGPPASAFTVRIDSSENREAALKLGADITAYLRDVKLKRIDGSEATFKAVSLSNSDVYSRSDGKAFVEVTGNFEDADTSTLVTLAENSVKEQFNESKVESYGLSKNAVSFDLGQESENQDSFKTLALAFPLVMLAIYILLLIEFRSFLQPLLIFMAIPFSFFGIALGLYLTDNPFSFFAMLGFFALIGLSIKNTILLTDYANQSRRAGHNPVDSAHQALAERFRPLIATSLTAVVSLVPLALTSPFWEGLSVVLIFGLISSTFLVVTVFPYYYLMGEFLRGVTGRGFRRAKAKFAK